MTAQGAPLSVVYRTRPAKESTLPSTIRPPPKSPQAYLRVVLEKNDCLVDPIQDLGKFRAPGRRPGSEEQTSSTTTGNNGMG